MTTHTPSAIELKTGIWELDGKIILSAARLARMANRHLDFKSDYAPPQTFDATIDWCLPIVAFAAEFRGEPILAEAQRVFTTEFA